MLVEVSPISDGALHLAERKLRAWRIQVDVRLFRRSEESAFASRLMGAESAAPLPRQP